MTRKLQIDNNLGDDMADLESLIQLLQLHQWKLCTAESCTGGLLSAKLTEVSGSSQWFDRAYITYSNQAKHQMLSVPEDLIARHGAVSEEDAEAMAVGGVLNGAVDCCVSITGIAGPTGGTKEKPVGTVCFGFYHRDKAPMTVSKYFPDEGRQAIREQSCRFAIYGLCAYLAD